MRFILAVLVAGLLAAQAAAQPFYARGSFNSFGLDHPMIDSGDGIFYTRTVDGLFADTRYTFKIANEGYTLEAPAGFAQDIAVWSDSTGAIDINFWNDNTWEDGWQPTNARRVGYADSQVHDWEIVGAFNGFPGTNDPAFALTDQGNGLHKGTFAFNAGIYDWKFRRVGSGDPWDTNIGNNGFSGNAGNNTFAVANTGDMWTFELDVPNGRWRTVAPQAPTQPGDHNGDGSVNAADYVTWRNDPNSFGGNPGGYNTWRANFGNGAAAASWLVFGPQIPTTNLVSQGGGLYTATLSGLTASTDYELKAAKSDLSVQVPGSNVKIRANASGAISVKFYELTAEGWGDGWQPNNEHRVGYVDHNLFDWELMGDFNGFSAPVAQLTDQGNGLHTGTYIVEAAGAHQFKFRQQGDWGTSIGNNFGNGAANATFTSAAANELWHFELDLPNGKWRAYLDGGGGSAVPEPGSLVLLVVGCLAAFGARKRK